MVRKLRQNSFQKNGFLNVNNTGNIRINMSDGQFGRRTIEEIRDDMWAAKEKKVSSNNQSTGNNNPDLQGNNRSFRSYNDLSNQNHKQNVTNLRNLDRWK